MRLKIGILATIVAIVLWAAFTCAAEELSMPDPGLQLKSFLDKMATHLKSEAFSRGKKTGQYRGTVAVASEGIDFREMSRRVLGKQWETLTSEQQGRFVDLFSKLLKYTYIKKITQDADKKVEIKRQRIRGRRAEVKTMVTDQGGIKPVAYRMILKNRKWMIYDIIVEGISLVHNYGEQMRGILRDKQIAGLLTMLSQKVNKLEVRQRRGQS